MASRKQKSRPLDAVCTPNKALRLMSYQQQKCRPHGIVSAVRCTNFLQHESCTCPQLICDDCFEYSESFLNLLPHRTSIYCYDCIQNIGLMTKCKPHGIKSDTQCDNILPTGKSCQQLICKYCINKSNECHQLLPSSLSSYCEDCINDLKQTSVSITQLGGNLITNEKKKYLIVLHVISKLKI